MRIESSTHSLMDDECKRQNLIGGREGDYKVGRKREWESTKKGKNGKKKKKTLLLSLDIARVKGRPTYCNVTLWYHHEWILKVELQLVWLDFIDVPPSIWRDFQWTHADAQHMMEKEKIKVGEANATQQIWGNGTSIASAEDGWEAAIKRDHSKHECFGLDDKIAIVWLLNILISRQIVMVDNGHLSHHMISHLHPCLPLCSKTWSCTTLYASCNLIWGSSSTTGQLWW